MSAEAEQASDLELLGAYARSRDAEAFAELARRYGVLVYGTALRITRSDADAQDDHFASAFSSLAHVSRNATVRLNTSRPERESGSTQK